MIKVGCIKNSLLKNKSVFFIIFLALIFGAIYFVFDPSEGMFFPSCPFKSLTGFDCPGCGSQRAIHEILHLNFKKAFEYNALLVSLIPYLILAITLSTKQLRNYFSKTRKFFFNPQAILILLGIALAFGIFRNI